MTEHNKIGIILIDDHRRVHQVIAEMIGFFDDIELLAQGSNGLEAIALCEQYQPDLILMDIVMPVMDGVEATKRILEKYPHIKILALSSYKDHETVRAILENGAIGFILKDSSVDDLENTIRTAYEGQSILSPEIMHALLETPKNDVQQENSIENNLSLREQEVLRCVANGMTNLEIAKELTISISTVKFHIVNILSKLQVETRAEAIVIAAKNKLV